MRFIPLFLGVVYLATAFAVPADAREPRCGGVDDDVVEDVYEEAEDLEFYRDYLSVIEDVCAAAEVFDDVNLRGQRDLRAQRREMFERIEADLSSLRGNLQVINIWRNANRVNSRERVIRAVQIRRARLRAEDAAARLDDYGDRIFRFLKQL